MRKLIVAILILVFLPNIAFATKCLNATNLSELKKDFSIIIRGVVVSKAPVKNKLSNYKLKIKVAKYIYGKLSNKQFEGYTVELDSKMNLGTYEIGKEYTFPVSKTKKTYNVIIPAPGCPIYEAE